MNEEDLFLFPTKITIIDNFLSEQECNELVAKAKSLSPQPHPAIEEGLSYHERGKFLEDTKSTHLMNRLEEIMKRLTESHGYKYKGLDNSWFNIQKPNTILYEHTHPCSLLSGALYLQVNEFTTPLSFRNPNPYVFFGAYKNFNDSNFTTYAIKPEIGSLIVFPSWLQHFVGQNDKETIDRIVLSFNTKN